MKPNNQEELNNQLLYFICIVVSSILVIILPLCNPLYPNCHYSCVGCMSGDGNIWVFLICKMVLLILTNFLFYLIFEYLRYQRKESEWKMNKLIPERRKHGCDRCYKDVPTQLFLGYNKDVLWICGKCYTMLTRSIEKQHKQDIWTYKEWCIKEYKK